MADEGSIARLTLRQGSCQALSLRRGSCQALPTRWTGLVTLAFAAFFGGCHKEEPATPSVTVVSGGVSYPEDPEADAYLTEAGVSAMADDFGDVVIGTAAGALAPGDEGLEPLPVYQDSDEMLETGAIVAIARRADGLILAADGGIFLTSQGYLLQSPLTETVAGLTVRSLAAAGEDDAEAIWIAADEGLFRATDSSFDLVALPGESGAPTAVGALERIVLVAYGSRVYEVSTLDWSVVAAPDGLGEIRAIRIDQEVAYLASDQGLVVRSGDGSYTRYTLADEGAAAVKALALDWSGRPVVLIADGVIRLEDGVVAGIAGLEAASGDRALALDLDGNVWIGEGTGVTVVKVGEPASFASDVTPIFASRCNSCHLDGAAAPAHDFTDYNVVVPLASSIMERLATGQMPPTGPLPENEYAAVLRWYTGGQNP